MYFHLTLTNTTVRWILLPALPHLIHERKQRVKEVRLLPKQKFAGQSKGFLYPTLSNGIRAFVTLENAFQDAMNLMFHKKSYGVIRNISPIGEGTRGLPRSKLHYPRSHEAKIEPLWAKMEHNQRKERGVVGPPSSSWQTQGRMQEKLQPLQSSRSDTLTTALRSRQNPDPRVKVPRCGILLPDINPSSLRLVPVHSTSLEILHVC